MAATNYVYLLQEREFINANQSVFKVGRTRQENSKRLKQYPKGSVLKLQITCNDCISLERQILAKFRSIFKQRTDIGSEYFEGSCDKMIEIINSYISGPIVSANRAFTKHKAPNFMTSDAVNDVVIYYEDAEILHDRKVLLQRTLNGNERFPLMSRLDKKSVFDDFSDGVVNAKSDSFLGGYSSKKGKNLYFSLWSKQKINEFCKNKHICEVIRKDAPRCAYFCVCNYDTQKIIESIKKAAISFGFMVKGEFISLNFGTITVLILKSIGFKNTQSQSYFHEYLEQNDPFLKKLIKSSILHLNEHFIPLIGSVIDGLEITSDVKNATDAMVSECFIDGCQLYEFDEEKVVSETPPSINYSDKPNKSAIDDFFSDISKKYEYRIDFDYKLCEKLSPVEEKTALDSIMQWKTHNECIVKRTDLYRTYIEYCSIKKCELLSSGNFNKQIELKFKSQKKSGTIYYNLSHSL